MPVTYTNTDMLKILENGVNMLLSEVYTIKEIATILLEKTITDQLVFSVKAVIYTLRTC